MIWVPNYSSPWTEDIFLNLPFYAGLIQNETHFGLFRWELRFHGSQQLGLGCTVNYPKWLFSPHVVGDIFWCILRTWLLTARHYCMCKMHEVDKVRSTRCWKDDGDPCGYVVGFYHHTVSSIPYILRLWIWPIITLKIIGKLITA